MLGLLLAVGPAFAGGPEVWAALYDARLAASVDRDPAAAVAVYETVIEHLPEEDPIGGEMAYWLGRARHSEGRIAEASEALRQASLDPATHDRARKYLGLLALETRQVRALPYVDTFDHGTGAWIRGWPRGQEADLGISQTDGPADAALTWDVDIVPQTDDFLVIALAPEAGAPQRVRMFVRTALAPAWLRLVWVDVDGRRWSSSVIEANTAAWTPVDLPVSAFMPADAPGMSERPDPGGLVRLELRDVTGFHGDPHGSNRVIIDDFEIR